MPVKLILEENKVYILHGNPKIDNFIDRVTRFKASGFERTDKFKEGKWDGYTRLYKKTDRSFPIGLRDTVEMMLILKDVDYQVIDNRIFRSFKQIPITHKIELRDYQETAVSNAKHTKRGLIQLPTGAGKTIVGIYLVGSLKVPSVFYVHKKELLYQTIQSFKKTLTFKKCKDCSSKSKKNTGKCKHDKCPVGIVGDGQINIRQITVAMVQSVNRLPPELFNDFGIAIFDEVHHLGAKIFYEIASRTKTEYLFGLTATPWREDGKELMLEAGAGPIISHVTISDLIKRKYLAKPHIRAIRIPPMMFDRRDNYQTVYKKAIVYNTDRNEQIAIKAVEMSVYGPVYIHVKRIDHGTILTNIINKKMVSKGSPKAIFINGTDKTAHRNNVLDKFRIDELPILVSTLLGEGVDLPNMYGLILASGGLSKTYVIQVMGRLLRISENEIVEFYDVADQCKYLHDHFIGRVSYYQAEPEFVLEEYLQNMVTG